MYYYYVSSSPVLQNYCCQLMLLAVVVQEYTVSHRESVHFNDSSSGVVKKITADIANARGGV